MSAWSVRRLGATLGRFSLGPVDLSLGEQESVAILGESGAGKTTLLRALAGLLPGTRGAVVREVEDVSGWPPERRGAVYVPPGLALFPHRSVARNVRYPLELSGAADPTAATRELIDRFGLTPLADRLPSTLSTGEQQRVALARALAARPRLLLWDEPLAALDVLSRDALLATLRDLREREAIPLLFVTHDPALAFSVADRWLLLEAGRPVHLGSPGAFLARPPNRFAARFVGFENVYGPDELAVGPSDELPGALARQAGPAGIALSAPRAVGEGSSLAGGRTARVERVEPAPDSPRLTARCEGLSVRLIWAGESSQRLPRPGETVRFDLESARTVPLGLAAPSPEAT